MSEPRRHLLPKLSLVLWLVFFLTLCLSNWRLVLISADGDPCLHRRIGDWMIDHRAVLRTEQFSHTRLNAPLISKEWLSEVVSSGVARASGWNGIVLLAAALIATTLWLLHRQLLAEGCELLISTALVMVAAWASSVHWLARPHLTTHLLTVIFAWQLRDYDLGRITPKRLFLVLTPLMLLWANLHGAFFTGFVMIGAFGLGAMLSRDKTKFLTLFALGVACVLVSFINPNGWNLHTQILGFLRAPKLVTYVSEFRSPNFHQGGTRGFAVLLLVITTVFLVVRPRLRITEIVVMAVWGYFSLQAVRNIPIFAFVVTPILGAHVSEFFRAPSNAGRWSYFKNLSANLTGLDRVLDGRLTVATAAAAIILTMAVPPAIGKRPLVVSEPLTNCFPVAAVQYLQSTNGVVTGEMFNSYGWGGYLLYAMPERKVFVDGRNDFYGSEFLDEFDKADDVKPGWETVFEKYHVGWTILPPKHPLNAMLALRADWKQTYTDEVAVVYGKRWKE